jgi:hypothetical protein
MKTMEPKFKKGEWCFCEFVLQQVKETKDDRITEVSDGMMSHSGRDLSDRCYPLEMKIKVISDHVKFHSDAFHKLPNRGLNYPDLHRELIRRWAEACEVADDVNKLKEALQSISKWANEVTAAVHNLGNTYVGDVALFRS